MYMPPSGLSYFKTLSIKTKGRHMKWFGEVDGSCVGVIVMDMMYDVVWIFL